MKIAIVGSGLAGISAAHALVRRGIKPTILDFGLKEDPQAAILTRQMSLQSPTEWSEADKSRMFFNPTVKGGGFLRKLAFGSDYFYGASIPLAQVVHDGVVPPFSYAKGGFSVGWGASVLPPADCDLGDWPIKLKDLAPYFRQVLAQVPYSARHDELAKYFPLYSDKLDPLALSSGNKKLLHDLKRASHKFEPGKVVYGQARLLTRASSEGRFKGCQFCGQCMSGCVYDCIYKASQSLDRLLKENQVEYQSGVLVDSLKETGDRVEISVMRDGGSRETLSFDRVFLAAGAVNTTRVILKSKNLYDREVRMLANNGFVAPFFRLRSLGRDWPRSNTQPAIFLEFKDEILSSHWIHTQISTPNELVYEMLGIRESPRGIVARLKRWAAEHMVVGVCNLHSDHSNGYVLELKREDDKEVLHSKFENRPQTIAAHQEVKNKLAKIGRKLGWHMLKSKAQHSYRGGGFHTGGTMPMVESPRSELETDLFGRPMGFGRIHVVDSSVFPSLPATTVGLLAMANATRVAAEAPLT